MLTNLPIRFVCATRENEESFYERTLLGRTLSNYRFLQLLQTRVFFENSRGLSDVYNIAIRESEKDPAILVFIHDDVCISDFYWPSHIHNALKHFGVVGVAGNKQRLPRQPSWAFIDDKFTWDARENLSGVVGHGRGFPCSKISVFGQPAQEVRLLDGLMLVCASRLMHEKNLWFDERFSFHFYDLDLCRQAEQRGIRIGTWPISVVHESGGSFGSEAWREGYRTYLAKWGE